MHQSTPDCPQFFCSPTVNHFDGPFPAGSLQVKKWQLLPRLASILNDSPQTQQMLKECFKNVFGTVQLENYMDTCPLVPPPTAFWEDGRITPVSSQEHCIAHSWPHIFLACQVEYIYLFLQGKEVRTVAFILSNCKVNQSTCTRGKPDHRTWVSFPGRQPDLKL